MRIYFPEKKDLSKDNVEYLCNLINREYETAELGLLLPGTKRISTSSLLALLKSKAVLLAEIDDNVIGCVHFKKINTEQAIFGMLTADQNHRGIGVGRELVKAAEKWAVDAGCMTMCLELLMPKEWQQAHKEFLKAWYTRLGYIEKSNINFEMDENFATPCDFVLYQKQLT